LLQRKAWEISGKEQKDEQKDEQTKVQAIALENKCMINKLDYLPMLPLI
jgi:hypothetical protein